MAKQIADGSNRTGCTKRGLSVTERRSFLDHLAATGSVEAAAGAVAIAPLQAYAACRTDAGFAQGWRAALRVGYDRLEAMLIERTGAVLAGEASGPLETEAPVGKRSRSGAGAADKTDAAILKRLAMLGKRQAAEEARARRAQGGGDA
jgi:hypothetical protein